MTGYSMTIDGELVAGSTTFDVVNPATGVVFAHAPACSEDELERAVAAATSAYRTWRTDEGARRECLLKAADRLEASTAELSELLTKEQGKPLSDAAMEIETAVGWLRYYAALETQPELLQDDNFARVEVHRQPLGPVAAITPWNVPIALAFWKVAPALRAGNTVVLKPSPYTPLTTLRVGAILADVLPAGVLNVVSGLDPLGAQLTAHPSIRKITFTGSTQTGKHVAAAAAADLKRVTLELGGNDPAIVLDDADPAAVAAGIYASSMANAGQVCVAIKRAYVPRKMYADVVDALVAHAAAARVGNGLDAGVVMGPLNNRPQRDRVAGLVADAVANGAVAVAGGGAMDSPGYFYTPTILTNVDERMPIVAEEQFGPALPVLPYDNVADAVACANDSHFGLGSSIWTSDVDRGAKLGREIIAGTTWINTHCILMPTNPFGGVKWSGIGVENGVSGLHEFTDVHVLYQNRYDGMYANVPKASNG